MYQDYILGAEDTVTAKTEMFPPFVVDIGD